MNNSNKLKECDLLVFLIFKLIIYVMTSLVVALITKKCLGLDIHVLRLALSYFIIRWFLTFKIELQPKCEHFE